MRLPDPRPLLPSGLVVEAVRTEPERLVVLARLAQARRCRPGRGEPSGRVHGHHRRRLLDLPCMGGRSSCACGCVACAALLQAVRG